MEHCDKIGAFYHLQNTHSDNLRAHLQGDESLWAYVLMELETDAVRGIAYGSTNTETNETSLETILSDDNNAGLTEYLLRHVLATLKKKNIAVCSMPAQEIYRSGIRTIKTAVSSMLENFEIASIRYVLYPAHRFEQPDAEALNVLRTYCHMYHRFYSQAPFFYNAGYKKLDAAFIDSCIPSMKAIYSRPQSAILTAYFKDVIIAASAVTPLDPIEPQELDNEYLIETINALKNEPKDKSDRLLKTAYETNVLVDEGFRRLGIRISLEKQLIEFSKKMGYSGFSFITDKLTLDKDRTLSYGFTTGPDFSFNWPTNMPDGSVQNSNHTMQLVFQYF